MTKFTETNTRTIVKVISWRICLTISHVMNGVLATGSWMLALQIAGMAAVINSLLYWMHERSWNILQWNRSVSSSRTFNEGQPRSLTKIVSWRILITASNFFVPYFVTGSFGDAAIFAGLATVINMLIFWLHERAWNRIKWQKQAR